MPNLSNRRTLAALAVAGLTGMMTGCGGGGGDSGGSAVVVPTTPVAVTAANQDAVSRTAAAAAQGGFANAAVPLSAGPGRARALAAGSAGASSRPLTAVFTPLVTRALRSPAVMGRAAISAVIDLGSEACLVSGTSRTTLDDRDNSGAATVGDVVSVSFSNCVDVQGEVINGSLSIALTQLATSPALSFVANATITGLGFSAGSDSVVYDGDMALSYVETTATVTTVNATIGNQLVVRIANPTFSDTIAMLAGYRITTVSDSTVLPPAGTLPGRSTTTTSGQVASVAAGGKVTVSTLAPVVQYDALDVPSSGQLRAVGTTGSATLTVVTGGQVRIDLDTDGNGSIDETKTVDWNYLF